MIELITVFFSFAGATFFATAGFRTTVVVLESLVSLIALPLPTFGAEAVGIVLFPRPAPAFVFEEVALVSVPFRVAPPLVVLAFSTMFVRIDAAPPIGAGATGFRGEIGRASWDLAGEAAVRTGDRGTGREFAERGERT